MLSPIGVAVILGFPSGKPSSLKWPYFGWVVYFCILSIAVTFLSWAGVRIFHSLTPALEACLTSRGRLAYDRWANIATADLPQLVFAVVFSAGSLVALRLAVSIPEMNQRLYVGLGSYYAVGTCGFFIAGAAYWIAAGTILSIILARPSHMELLWHNPAQTPGLDLLARCYRMAFYGASVGVALCLAPILSWAYKGPDSPLLTFIKGGLFLSSTITALGIAIIPQMQLSLLVARQRRLTIDYLSSLLPRRSTDAIRNNPDDERVMAWLQLAVDSQATTIKESTVAGILLGMSTALLPYMLKFVS
jgi:hypothetical protein